MPDLDERLHQARSRTRQDRAELDRLERHCREVQSRAAEAQRRAARARRRAAPDLGPLVEEHDGTALLETAIAVNAAVGWGLEVVQRLPSGRLQAVYRR